MSASTRRHRIALVALPALIALSACGTGGENRDTAAAPAATPGPGANPADTGIRSTSSDSAAAAHNMGGMRHDSMGHGTTTDTTRRSRSPR